MGNLREEMQCSKPYWQFNREERNRTALLYHALLTGQNLWRFLHALHAQDIIPSHWGPAEPRDVSMYVEYALPRDLWARRATLGDKDTVNAQRRQAVLDLLEPANRDQLERASIKAWNAHFGADPASDKWIQFPGRWQVTKLNSTIDDDEEFLKTCKFKWAFNIKPDLVIHLNADRAIVIEAKYDSGESGYPPSGATRDIIIQRGGQPIGQTEVQEYLFRELLGIDAVHVHLSKKATKMSGKGHAMTWQQAFAPISDQAKMMPFVKDSINAIRDLETMD